MIKNVQGIILGVFILSLVLGLFFAGASSPFNSPHRPIFAGMCLFVWGVVVTGSLSWEKHSFLFRAIVKISESHVGVHGARVMGLILAFFGVFCIYIGISKL